MIRLPLNSSETANRYTWYTYEAFQDKYMRGFGELTEAPDEELAAAITFLSNERRKAQRRTDTDEVVYIEKQLNRLRVARDTKKKMQKGTYELERQITDDIWNCIHNTEVDFDALKEIRAKYRDNISLYRRIENRILNKERWYD